MPYAGDTGPGIVAALGRPNSLPPLPLLRWTAGLVGLALMGGAVFGLQSVRASYEQGLDRLCARVTWGAGGTAVGVLLGTPDLTAPSPDRLVQVRNALSGVVAVRWRAPDGSVGQSVGQSAATHWADLTRPSPPAPAGRSDIVIARADFPLVGAGGPAGQTLVASSVPVAGGGLVEVLTDITEAHGDLVTDSRRLGTLMAMAGLAGLLPLGYAVAAGRRPARPFRPAARGPSRLGEAEAGAVAHDLNNLLAIIDGSARLLERLSPDAEAARTHARRIEDAVRRGATLSAGLTRGRSLADRAAVPETAGPPGVGRRLILLVEDDDDLRSLYEGVLTEAGHDVLTAADGAAALAMLPAGPFDLVISDVAMPGMDGLSLARALRRQAPDTPVVLMTGYAPHDRSDVPDGTTVLAKPFRPETLVITAARMVAAGSV